MKTRTLLAHCALALAISLHSICGVEARQFRQLRQIASPTTNIATLPANARPVSQMHPLSREQVAPLVEKVISAWNTAQLGDMLGTEFYDSSRLTDAVNRLATRDATLRLQSVQGVQTLQQYYDGEDGKLVSIVSATVRTQLEFNDPQNGFQRRPGVNEYILKITQTAPPP
ncbi:MAG TPA: hypothetical protein VMH34_00960 [Gammaproteobacteria bacterium]|nr:hypothetical protein [Gammaproteobacteria bacterium]